MKAKVFEVILPPLPAGAPAAGVWEEMLNRFLAQPPQLRVVATPMNTIVAPAPAPAPGGTGSGAESRPARDALVIFGTRFYTTQQTH